MEQAPLPANANWPPREVVLVLDSAIGERLARSFAQARHAHLGVFDGYDCTIAGMPAAIAIAEPAEDGAYAALRQLHYLYRPKLALQVVSAIALQENLRAGDLALTKAVRRVHIPSAVADNFFYDDEVLFSSDDEREHVLDAPVLEYDPKLIGQLQPELLRGSIAGSLQSTIPIVAAGCGPGELPKWRGAEFVRKRFDVDVVDRTSYGFVRAAHDLQLPAATLSIISDGLSGNVEVEFERYAARFFDCASKAVESALPAVLG